MRIFIDTRNKEAFQKACALSDYTCSFGEEENGCIWAEANAQSFTADHELRELRHFYFGQHYAEAKAELLTMDVLLP